MPMEPPLPMETDLLPMAMVTFFTIVTSLPTTQMLRIAMGQDPLNGIVFTHSIMLWLRCQLVVQCPPPETLLVRDDARSLLLSRWKEDR